MKSLRVCLALLLLVAGTATAQETRGSIEGVVKDGSGAVVPGATVEARAASGAVAAAVSDQNGRYRFPSLTPGRYSVASTLTGFRKAAVENVQLELGQVLSIDLTMQLGGVTEDVQVTAESPIIDVKQNAAAASIRAEVIERIPRGRNFTTAITSVAGTNNEAKAGGIAVDGATGSENRYVIDGLDTTNLLTGVSAKNVLADFVEEIQVKSSGYNAEYRATTGGVISAVTRSGTNQFRGSIGTYYDNDKWLGDVRPTLRLVPSNTTQAEYTRVPRDPAYNVEPVMDLGGPIFRNRAWFFAGYAPTYSSQERTVRFTSNNETRTFVSDGESHNVNYHVTSQISNSLRGKLAGTFQRGIGAETLPNKEQNGTSTSTFSQFPNPLTTDTSNDSYSGELAWVVTPRLFVNTKLGYLTYNSWSATTTQFSDKLRHVYSGSTVCNPSATPGSNGCPFPEIPAEFQQLNSFSDLPVSTQNVRDKFGRMAVNADATYYLDFAGQHNMKGGIQFERLSNDVLTGAQAPTVTLNWNAQRTTLDNPPRSVRGTYGYYTVARFYTEGDIHSNNLGFFIQDAWTIKNRLTLNLGLRADSEEMPSYRPENPGLEFSLRDKLAPRVGFAYDLKGDGKWKGYGSWGVFYDISKLQMPRGAWGAERWIDYHYTLDTFNYTTINCDGPTGSGCPGTFIEQADRRHVSNEPGNFLVEPNLKPVRTQEFTVGLDHELSRTMSVGVRYAHKWLNKTIEDVGIQVAGIGEVFMIANPGFGIAEYTLGASCPSCPAQPPAQRDYDGVEFKFKKRLANRWSLDTSYLWSRTWGNYSGLSSSDENGRNAPSVLRFFDGLYMSFDQAGRPVFGPLQTDRPHQFKLQGSYDLPWGTIVGLNYFAASGTPEQSSVSVKSVPVFDLGRNSLGRTPTYNKTDLSLFHTFSLPGRLRLSLNAIVNNVFDQDTATRRFTARFRDGIPVSDAQFFAGFDALAIAAANPGAVRPDSRYLQPDQFLGARDIRVFARIMF